MNIIANKIDYDIPHLGKKSNLKRAKWVHTKLIDIVYNQDSLPFNFKWLDTGAGDGGIMRKMINNRQLFTSNVDLDIEKYPFEDNCFDIITSLDVIEHLYNPLFHLFECKRILSDRGILIINTCNDYSLIYKAEHLLSRKYKGHFHQFSEYDLRGILQRAGLSIIEFKKYFRPTSGTIARISRKEFIVVCKK